LPGAATIEIAGAHSVLKSEPVMEPDPAAHIRDSEHLRLLRVFHYVFGGLTIAFSSLFIIHATMGVAMYLQPEMLPMPQMPNQPTPPREMWLMLAGMSAGFVVLGWMVGILTIVSGSFLKRPRGRTFSIVVAAVNCFAFPFGTALGVCTLLALTRPSVVRMYDEVRTAA